MEKASSIVIIKKFPFDVQRDNIFPLERKLEIDECKSEKSKNEKYYVWMLLQESLKNFFEIDINKTNIKKLGNGKWVSDKFKFSLSHSKDLVAVAISLDKDIGVDIQERKDVKINNLVRNSNDIKASDDVLFSIKESIFKRNSFKNFIPKDIETNIEDFYCFDIISSGCKYILSVAFDENIKVLTDNDISVKVKNFKKNL